RNKDKPFLLYVAFDNPHIPLFAPAKSVAAKADAFHPTYAALIESLDTACGRILGALERNGLAKNTLVAFASDNGGVHISELKESPATYNAPSRAGKGFLYEGGIRTPLIIRYPARLAPAVISEPVVLGDLCPTICALAKVAAPATLDFQDISPVLFEQKPLNRPLFWHQPHYMNQGGKPAGVAREGEWKLIEQYEDGSLELYNLAKDPSETTDLASAESTRVAALRGKLEAWRRSVGAESMKANPNFSRTLWEDCFVKTDVTQLKALPTSEAMRPLLADWRKAMNDATTEGANSLIFLEARDAKVKATKMKYEEPPQKDTLGFWVNAEDTASWTFQAPKAGTYRVTVLQGCGKGNGGSVVALDTKQGSCEFTVEETGHFQRFVPREIGKLTLVAGENTLTVRPVKKAKAAVMAQRTKCRDFRRAVDHAIFGCVGNRQCCSLHLMHIVANAVQTRRDRFRRHLGAVTFDQHQLRASGVETRCTAFINLNMGFTVANDALMWLNKRRKREAIGTCARCHPQHRDIAAEHSGECGIEPRTQLVTVICGIDMVGIGHGLHDSGVHRGGIVREETHDHPHGGKTRLPSSA
ncbi:MAG: Arylsulfatase, partial [Pseudomonadota bacterium]